MERETRIELATCSWKAAALPTELLPHDVGTYHFEVLKLVVRKDSNLRNFRSGVTVRPFDRSGTSPFLHLHQCRSLLRIPNSLRWCRHTDSNCGPTDYKSVALPTELCRRFLVFRTFRIGTVCSLAKLRIRASVFSKTPKLTKSIRLMIIQPL